MVTFRSMILAAFLLGVGPGFSQTTQDRASPNPQTTQPAAPPSGMTGPGMMGGGVMGRGMMGGGNMMSQTQMGSGGMMPMMNMMMRGGAGAEHIEGRLAYIKAELKITDAQTPQWNAYADATRGNAKAMSEMRDAMMARQGTPGTLPERLAFEDKAVSAHLAALKKTAEAVNNLYGVLNDDQKKTADSIVVGPMGMPMGMM
jgi:hypothetical protein